MTLEWTPSMSVGNKDIDMQHQKILNQINQLIEDIDSGQDLPALRTVITFLRQYAQEHFEYEENYMREIGYPGLESQIQAHKKFVEFSTRFREDFYTTYKSGKFSWTDAKKFAEQARQYLGDWLINHILVADMDYYTYAKSKGLSK